MGQGEISKDSGGSWSVMLLDGKRIGSICVIIGGDGGDIDSIYKRFSDPRIDDCQGKRIRLDK